VATHIKPWGNWWSTCISGAGTAALVLLGENDQSERWIRLAKEAMDWFWSFKGGYVPKLEKELPWAPEGTYYPANFDVEGGYWEGLNYLESMQNIFYFTEPYLRVMGEEILPLNLMKKVSNYILYNSYREDGRIRCINFDDTRENHFTSPFLTGFLARKLKHSGMQWYFVFSQRNFEEASQPTFVTWGERPAFSFLWYDPSLKPKEPEGAEPVKVFPGIGWAVMRTGWKREDRVFILKCGITSGHAHPDAGTFVINYQGKSLVIDSGVSSYEIPEYQGYYRTSRAHNVVLVGKEGQKNKLPGEIKEHLGVPRYCLLVADATQPYEGALKKFVRNALEIDGKYYVLIDELLKDAPDPFHWLLHYGGSLTRNGKDFILSNGEARLLMKMFYPQEKRTELIRADYLSLTPGENRNRETFFSLLYPFSEEEKFPEITEFSSENWVAFKVRREEKSDIVAVSKQEPSSKSSENLEGIDTDAQIFALTRINGETTISLLLKHEKYFSVNGKVFFSSSVPCSFALTVEYGIKIALEVKENASLRLSFPISPEKFFLDRNIISNYQYDSSTRELSLFVPKGKHSLFSSFPLCDKQDLYGKKL
jgi:hypothetical protein